MIILFGQNGQIAQELRAEAAARNISCRPISREEGDFRNPDRVASLLAESPSGSFVINAAGCLLTSQTDCNGEAAIQINGRTPGVIARACQQRGHKLIHISASDVFSGNQQRAYREHEPTGPLGVYGESKLLGERLILENLEQAIILRTSWVFSAYGSNIATDLIQQETERDDVPVVADQVGGPTSAASIARTCLELVAKTTNLPPSSDLWGVYHYCGKPSTTRRGFAEELFRLTGQDVVVTEFQPEHVPTSARLPMNSILACGKILKNFEIEQPDWAIDLTDVVRQLGVGEDSSADQLERVSETHALQKARI